MPSENPIGQPFIHLATVESTNNYAMAQAQAQMAVHGAAWLADYQTMGKGQRGKIWKGEPGQNIFLSILIQPVGLLIAEQFKLSAVIALGCFDLFSKYALDETKIKWPNDIYWKDRKAGGILIENIIKGNDWSYAIAGIGLNINQTTFQDVGNAVSLKQITGKTFDVVQLAQELCSCIELRWISIRENPLQLNTDYNKHLYKLHEMVNLKKHDQVFSATVTGVNETGQLVLDQNDLVNFGEVEWVIA